MKEVYTIMTATLGVPPMANEKFTWDYYDKDGKAGHWEGTAREFYKTFASDKYSVRLKARIVRWAVRLMGPPAIRVLLAHQRPAQRVRQAVLGREARERMGRPRRALSVLSCDSLLTSNSHICLPDVNTEIDDLKNAVVKMIKAGQPVFFGCDVGQFLEREAGIMDTKLFDFEVRCTARLSCLPTILTLGLCRRMRSTSSSASPRQTVCARASPR